MPTIRRVCSIVSAALVLVCPCSSVAQSAPEAKADEVKSLEELSVEQLRVFLRGVVRDWRQDTDQKKGLPQPEVQKPYAKGAHLVDLVRPDDIRVGRMPLAQAINQRRSRRQYTSAFLTNEELSFLLWSTQGIAAVVRDDSGRIVHSLRTVPSGGARHPFETYLVVNRVKGLRPGIYRFLPLEHKLLPLRPVQDLSRAIRDACYGQPFVDQAAVVFVWTAVPYRSEWRYTYIAHRMIAIEAGHVCQNLYLACESIGAGACAMLAYDQKRMDALLEVDGTNEFTIYIAPVGKVERTPE